MALWVVYIVKSAATHTSPPYLGMLGGEVAGGFAAKRGFGFALTHLLTKSP